MERDYLGHIFYKSWSLSETLKIHFQFVLSIKIYFGNNLLLYITLFLYFEEIEK